MCRPGLRPCAAAIAAASDCRRTSIGRHQLTICMQVNKGPFSLAALKELTRREAAKKHPPPQLALPPVELPPPPTPVEVGDKGGLRVGFLWTSTYDSEFANNLITMFEAAARIRSGVDGAGGVGPQGKRGVQGDLMAGGDGLELYWFSVNDAEDDQIGEYKARARARRVFGARFVAVRSGEERPDHSTYHEGVDAARQIRAYRLHMLFNLPGWLNEVTMSISSALPAAMQVGMHETPLSLRATPLLLRATPLTTSSPAGGHAGGLQGLPRDPRRHVCATSHH